MELIQLFFSLLFAYLLIRAVWLWSEYRTLRRFSSLPDDDFAERYGSLTGWVFPAPDGRFSFRLFFSFSVDKLASVDTALDPDPEVSDPGDALGGEEDGDEEVDAPGGFEPRDT